MRKRTFGGPLTAFLQNGQERRPAGRAEQLEGVGKGVGGGGAAEEGFFVLFLGRKEAPIPTPRFGGRDLTGGEG